MLVNFPMVRIFFCTSSFHFSSIPRSPSMASFLPCLSPPFDLFSPPSFTPVPFSAFVVPFFFLLFGPLNYLQVLSCDYVHLFFDSSPYFIILLDLIFFVAGYSPLFSFIFHFVALSRCLLVDIVCWFAPLCRGIFYLFSADVFSFLLSPSSTFLLHFAPPPLISLLH